MTLFYCFTQATYTHIDNLLKIKLLNISKDALIKHFIKQLFKNVKKKEQQDILVKIFIHS